MSRQKRNGDWPDEDVKGVFNHNCCIEYVSYKNIFTLSALARYNSADGSLESPS